MQVKKVIENKLLLNAKCLLRSKIGCYGGNLTTGGDIRSDISSEEANRTRSGLKLNGKLIFQTFAWNYDLIRHRERTIIGRNEILLISLCSSITRRRLEGKGWKEETEIEETEYQTNHIKVHLHMSVLKAASL